MNELIEYIKNNKITKKRLEGEIRDERNKKLPTRNAFVLLKKYAKEFHTKGMQPRMIALSGLRGVGKTTLAWQTANYIYNNHSKNIYFISVEDLKRMNATLYDVINILEQKIFSCSLNELDYKITLIIDEVHETENWQNDLKILYERGKKAFIIVTGSSALLLHSSPDLASRWTLMKIFPFNFTEFVKAKTWFINPSEILFPVKGLSKSLKNALFYSDNYYRAKKIFLSKQTIVNHYLKSVENFMETSINSILEEYISFGNIARFMPLLNKTLIIERILALFERILIKDIPETNLEYFDVFNRILLRLALSDQINFQTLSKEFRMKEAEIERLIMTLHNAEILTVFLPHGGVRTKTGKTQKVFFMSPSLRRALYYRIYGERLNENLRAKLYEDIVAMYLKREFSNGFVSFGFGKKKNPDFVVETMDSPVLIEVGTEKKTSLQIKKYGDYRYGIIINSKTDDIKFDDTNKIFVVPLKWFLLI